MLHRIFAFYFTGVIESFVLLVRSFKCISVFQVSSRVMVSPSAFFLNREGFMDNLGFDFRFFAV